MTPLVREWPLLGLLTALACATAPAPAPSPRATASAPAPAAPVPAKKPLPPPPTLRLPTSTRPVGYSVQLSVDPASETFEGVMDIDVELKEPTGVLWLNASELKVKEATVTAGGKSRPLGTVDGGAQLIGLAPEPLPGGEGLLGPGALHLRIAYTGKMSDKDSQGVFRQRDDGHWYVFTQFESTDARRAFPCFDEPSFKVPWQLTVRAPSGTTAFSNSPVERQETGADGWTTYRFARTPPLPSYLVAFAVGPFDVVDAGKAGMNGVPVRILTQKGRGPDAAYAAKISGALLSALEEYFGIPYPYQKLDLVSVPFTNTWGAMENVGLVTFSQPLMVWRKEDRTLDREQHFAAVAAHEFAHHWFGNLVTMAWWDDLWLNESFASWMEDVLLATWKPEWDVPIWRVETRIRAMGADSLASARRIHQPIEAPGDVVNAFDAITYSKGSAILSMFESYLGPEVLRRGVRRYLTKHAFGTATAEDFVAAISAEAGRDLAPVLSSFLDQPGVPLVTAELSCEQGRVPRLKLSQRRYLPLGSKGDRNKRWQIPLCARYGSPKSAGRACTLLTEAEGSLELPGPACPTWVMPNAGAAGYYRLAPRGDLLQKLFADGGRMLTVPERVGLLSDVNALVRSGDLPAGDALALMPRVLADGNRHLYTATVRIVSSVKDDLVPEAQRATFARFVRDLYGKRARELGFTPSPSESADVELLRPQLLSLVTLEGEDSQLVAEARAQANRWLEDRAAVAPELVQLVLRVAARHGDAALLRRMQEATLASKSREERQRLLTALAAFRGPEAMAANMRLITSGGLDIREALSFLRAAIEDEGPQTRELTYQWLKASYEPLTAKLPREVLPHLAVVAGGFCDAGHRADAEAFFKERSAKLPGGERVLAQVLETIDLCTVFKEKQAPSVGAFLQTYGRPASSPRAPAPR